MCKILPRGQPPLRRWRAVSGSGQVDKGAPSCVPAGLPRAWCASPAVRGGWGSGRHGSLRWVVQRPYGSVSKPASFALEGGSHQVPSRVLLVAQAREGVWSP